MRGLAMLDSNDPVTAWPAWIDDHGERVFSMKLLSWNIQWGRGADGVVDLQRTIAAIRTLGEFDVLCLQEVSIGFAGLHDNCTDNLRMAMLAVGLRAAEIPCPFNIWMNTPPLSDGSIAYRSPVLVPGDHVELRAELDCIAVVSACPMDLLPINGKDCVIRDAEVVID